MKKILAIFMMMLMVASLSVTAFAADEEPAPSVSGYPVPGIVDFDPTDEDCTAEPDITAYGDKDKLPDDLREKFEEAYEQLSNADDLTDLNDDFAKLVNEKNIDPKDLVVSDFFNIHTKDCEHHDGHHGFDMVLDADSLNNFAGLLHMNENGEWELVADAKVTNNGEHLQFSVDSLGPFAIVTATSTVPGTTTEGPANAPQTGMTHSSSNVYSVVMIACVAAAIVTAVKCRRRATR